MMENFTLIKDLLDVTYNDIFQKHMMHQFSGLTNLKNKGL